MESTNAADKMIYRYLGDSGLKVSVLGFGNWITGHSKEEEESQIECIKKSYELGVNFFDTAEIYGAGIAETIMGKGIKALPCERKDLVITTKIFSCGSGVNDTFLSRKHITESIHNSLERLQLDYVDVIFCHRPDEITPLEETCRAMHWIIEEGLAFYWATSEWSPERISQCMEICKRLKLHKPISDQCEYSALMRTNMEKNLRHSFENYKYGTTIWSPLAGGILSGKYNDGTVPAGTRYSDNPFAKNVVLGKYFGEKVKEKNLKILNGLKEIADEQGCTMAQLSIAWTIVNQDVSVCICGATKLSQVDDNMGALAVANRWTEELEKKINDLLDNEPAPAMDFNRWAPREPRRSIRVDYNFKPATKHVIFERFQSSTLIKK
jgi:voltage-dependent potassium channel beta subunit